MVRLSADGSTDPDGNGLSYRWWQYQEADSYRGELEITGANSKNAAFKAPGVDASATVHIILEIIDDGNPSLTDYRRVVVKVHPGNRS